MQESYTGSDVQLVNVNFSYGKKQILHNLSIDLSFGICGPVSYTHLTLPTILLV